MSSGLGKRNTERRPGAGTVGTDVAPLEAGDPVWVMDASGGQRGAEYLGARVVTVWRGEPPMVFVVYTDTHSAEAVETDRVIRRRTTASSA